MISVDVVLFTQRNRQLSALLMKTRERGHSGWTLPRMAYASGDDLQESAALAALRALGRQPAWLEQIGAFEYSTEPSADASLSVGFVGVTPDVQGSPPGDSAWFSTLDLPTLSPRYQKIVDAALATLRDRMDSAPIAYGLLPPLFTLSALQAIYELLLGRRFQKASFRRTLRASLAVEPTDEWRREGRGRPAQLFRYAPQRRPIYRRLRLDRLGG